MAEAATNLSIGREQHWLNNAASLSLMLVPVSVIPWEGSVGYLAIGWLAFMLGVAVAHGGRKSSATLAWAALRNEGAAGFAAFALGVVAILLVFGGRWSTADNPSRFLLLLPVAAIVAGMQLSARPWFTAHAIGAAIAAGLGAWQVFVQGMMPAAGFGNPNKFGYVSATLALLCLAAWRLPLRWRPAPWVLVAGCALGLFAMLLSGTRGIWIATALALLCWFALSRALSWRFRIGMLGLVVAGAVGLASIEQSGVRERFERTSTELQRYAAGDWERSSIGERFELWKAALIMIREEPLTGVGLGNYPQRLRELVAAGRIDPQVAHHGHAHNEYLHWFATGGIAGLLALCAGLFAPLAYFLRAALRLRASAPSPAAVPTRLAVDRRQTARASALAGCLFVFVTTIFCASDAFFYIHFASVYYVFTVLVLMGFVESVER